MSHHPSRNGHLDTLTPGLLSRGAIIIEDAVHLFERLASRLRHKEVHPDKRKQTEHSEENVSAKTGVLNQRWCDEADDEVEQPVTGS